MKETIGVIGAGRIGLPIIGHLVRAGFRTFATDIDPARRAKVQEKGGEWATDAASLSRECTVILVCVGYDREVTALLPTLRASRGSVVAILSTINPRTVQQLAREAKSIGIEVIDSTACRGEAADRGTLLSFVGGPKAAVERITPVLRAYSTDVVHTGDVGSAQIAKAVNNLILWACLVANHEGLALAQRFGLNTDELRKALVISSAANDALAKWGTQTMAWADDDMAIVAEMAAECGLKLPQAEITRAICRELKPRRYKLDEYGR
jgi:3-hydroxyisobutyrate dehydrogenase-like beta-hydroxyacid dehydrogenase